MANPEIKKFVLSGGVLDRKQIGVRCAPVPAGGDAKLDPPRKIYIAQSASVQAFIGSRDAFPVIDRVGDIFLCYDLYLMAGREDLEPIYRYVYSGAALFRPGDDAVAVPYANVEQG